MYDHIGLKVRDLEASVRFYTAALAPLGLRAVLAATRRARASARRTRRRSGCTSTRARRDRACTWRCARADRKPPSIASTRRASKPAGATTAAPGLRADYSPKYYAAFLLDPDGNNVEAVCLR